jgi:carboxyl-terminal processing protease
VILDKSRFTVGALAPGQTKELDFPLATDATLKADEVVLELMAYDQQLDAQSSDKLRFKVQPSVADARVSGAVTVKKQALIHAGAADDTSLVGFAPKGASYGLIGTFGPWTKVKLTAGGSKVGFIATDLLGAGGSGQGSYTPNWNSTPPLINVATKSLETNTDTYKLHGAVSDETHVEDVYIFVENRSAKIEQRKVFYRSNRGAKDGKLLDFTADLPLWPGSNMITVVARENPEVRSVKTISVFRDPPRTAQTP